LGYTEADRVTLTLIEAARLVVRREGISSDEAEAQIVRALQDDVVAALNMRGAPVGASWWSIPGRDHAITFRQFLTDTDLDGFTILREDVDALWPDPKKRPETSRSSAKDQAECGAWIPQQDRPKNKEALLAEARKRWPNLTERAFYRAWKGSAPAEWKHQGRKKVAAPMVRKKKRTARLPA
jgi:hypothetical protein